MTRKRQNSGRERSSRSQPQARSGGKLRIIGGEFRRRLLPVLESPGLRPTPDRVRETLFNWLGPQLGGARALDLFAGTGALGIEALSRGAAEVQFVERDPQVAEQLRANLVSLALDQPVTAQDASAFLATSQQPFSLVFLDPPFHQGLAAPCCAALENGWLTEQAYIYLETEASLSPQVPASWQLHRETRAGEGIARLYRRDA
ncbi:16S rRNA (guanine(966)-N(2))-methyltransferase RsmD [Halomonas sp. Bachu 37]|uniref:16S rRNA (guanine(966)-N(2))-methyltransferase RsmD n=1 Tax=Halomonas kashgarensis TaxID=3084920 RepID=UPI0032172679